VHSPPPKGKNPLRGQSARRRSPARGTVRHSHRRKEPEGASTAGGPASQHPAAVGSMQKGGKAGHEANVLGTSHGHGRAQPPAASEQRKVGGRPPPRHASPSPARRGLHRTNRRRLGSSSRHRERGQRVGRG
jgi:hypothetical protein